MKRVATAVILTGLMGGGVAVPWTLVAQSAYADPPPSPGCLGQVVAMENHVSVLQSPSGNPNASSGPGRIAEPNSPQKVSARVHEVQSACQVS